MHAVNGLHAYSVHTHTHTHTPCIRSSSYHILTLSDSYDEGWWSDSFFIFLSAKTGASFEGCDVARYFRSRNKQSTEECGLTDARKHLIMLRCWLTFGHLCRIMFRSCGHNVPDNLLSILDSWFKTNLIRNCCSCINRAHTLAGVFSFRQKISRVVMCCHLLLTYGLQFHSPSCQFPPGTSVLHSVEHW